MGKLRMLTLNAFLALSFRRVVRVQVRTVRVVVVSAFVDVLDRIHVAIPKKEEEKVNK